MNLRFPSLSEITGRSQDTFKRFPFALISALMGSIAAIWLVDVSWGQRTEYFYVTNFCWVSALSISVFISITTFAESRNWSLNKSLVLKFGALAVLALYYFLLPEDFSPSGSEPFSRYLLFFIAAHLLVSFAPFLQDGMVDDFWAYNKTLFLRILNALLYTVVLFIGLSIAMLSLENLLEFNISGKRYSQLWMFLIGLFNTWFFLAGVPHPNQLSQTERAYPGGLKVFVQYILIPLIAVYILILYLYTGKITIEWQWPNGWVANLVLSFSIAGILALLLLHPIRNRENNRWINLFSKGYYIALIPLVVLLMLSIWVRISEYGVTVNRFFVATLAVWLTGLVIYFLFGKAKNIKVIPISLCAVSLLISFGPLGAFEVSKRSQLGRFEQLLEKHELLSETKKIMKAEKSIPFEGQKQISSAINYLLELKGPGVLQPYFNEDLSEVIEREDSTDTYYSNAEKITRLIGIEYIHDWQTEEFADMQTGNFYYSLEPNSIIPITGYTYYLGEFVFNNIDTVHTINSGDEEWTIHFDRMELLMKIESISSEHYIIEAELSPVVNTLKELDTSRQNNSQIPLQTLTIEAENEGLEIKIVIKNINGWKKDSNITIQNLTAAVFAAQKN